MTNADALRFLLCYKGDQDSWGRRTALDLELALFGDPEKNRDERWEPLDLAAAVPLGEDATVRSFAAPPIAQDKAGAFLDEALHTLLVVLVDSALLEDGTFLDWLEACASHPSMIAGRHRLLVILRGDETKERWIGRTGRPGLGRPQPIDWSGLGEGAERTDWLALRLIHEALQLVARSAGAPQGWRARIFVSHAKKDGLPLARSLRDLLDQIKWLAGFYDAWDLGADGSWDNQLEEGVASSVLVALRTDIYDRRPYCQLEVQWAESHGSPMVLVDARSGLVHAASCLPFEAAPSVRIPDGNLLRVLHTALRVAVRSQLFRRQIVALQEQGVFPRQATAHVIPVPPGMDTILTACRAVAEGEKPRYIFYPEPRLSRGRLEAAKALAATVEAELVTPRELLLSEETREAA